MKHTIRQHVINEFGLPTVKYTTVYGELGSGIKDKHGNEIFANDRVRIVGYKDGDCEFETDVTYNEGAFWLAEEIELWQYSEAELEIVGRAEQCS